jgi:hypothetical protein
MKNKIRRWYIRQLVKLDKFIYKLKKFIQKALWAFAIALMFFTCGVVVMGEAYNERIYYTATFHAPVPERPKKPTAKSTPKEVKAYLEYRFESLDLTTYQKKALIKIAQCESGMRHHLPSGTIVRNTENKNKTIDSGLFQVNTVWEKRAKQLGLDLNDIDGQIKMAKVIIEEQGLNAWVCYRKTKSA